MWGGRIFHLLAASDWAADPGSGPVAQAQYERHGFVHCCTREQILEVASWWLAGDAPLVAIEIDAGRAGDVRFERADLGREYPHVYNPVPREAVVGLHDIELSDSVRAGGLPPRLASPPPAFVVAGSSDGRTVRVRWENGQLSGDADVCARATLLVEKGEDVPQFPGVTRPASTTTPYDAFCLLAAVLDDVIGYQGDGFIEP